MKKENRHLTVRKLRKALSGLDPNMPVYIADHDHAEFQTNSIAGRAEVIDQSKLDPIFKEMIEDEPMWKIDGPYLVIRP